MKNLRLLYYSPTGTTQKIVREIARGLAVKIVGESNLTLQRGEALQEMTDTDLVLIGMPVYGGRLPETALQRIKNVNGQGLRAMLVVVYGNRHYDDALLELSEVASSCGFSVVAGAAFIGEHSYSTAKKPIAKDRPDEHDLKKCREFAQLFAEKYQTDSVLNTPQFPGNRPYKERKSVPDTVHPETDDLRCTKCGMCVDVCPTDAIELNERVLTDGALCTLCCACVKVCPDEARVFGHPDIAAIKDRLFANCSARREPEFFL